MKTKKPLRKRRYSTTLPCSSEGPETFDKAAVLVSDLSGFTSGTRKHGIVHVASCIMRKRQLCLPILHDRGALFIGTEADNLIVILPDATSAVSAAVAMREAISRHNAALSAERSHFAIKLNGIGIHCGGPVVLDRSSGVVRGPTASLTYHIGEDLCSDGRILVSSAVTDSIASGGGAHAHDLRELTGEAEPGLRVFEVLPAKEGGASSTERIPLPSVDDARFLDPSLIPLCQRHADVDDAALAAHDEKLARMLMLKTVLMFRIVDDNEADAGYSDADADASRAMEERCLFMLRPLLKQCNGVELEGCLWCFESALDAIRGALAAKRVATTASGSFGVSGFGMHTGKMLFFEGTDVHWGDPVNTSSKLGQDLARGGALLISTAVRAELQRLAPRWLRRTLQLEPRDVTISKVNMTAYEVNTIQRTNPVIQLWRSAVSWWQRYQQRGRSNTQAIIRQELVSTATSTAASTTISTPAPAAIASPARPAVPRIDTNTPPSDPLLNC